jgi:hypothetical protein
MRPTTYETHKGPTVTSAASTDGLPGKLPQGVARGFSSTQARMCLSEASSLNPYIALSYVWGAAPQLKASKSNIQELMQDRSLAQPKWSAKLPRTISDAIGLARLLGERYLWIDSLCIVQDDEIFKHSQINAMASIYANSSTTIVAAQGDNADYGLRGVLGVSKPRTATSIIFEFGDLHYTLDEHYTFVDCPYSTLDSSVWSSRGWTFQESILSTRELIFCGNTVEWHCQYTTWRENLHPDNFNLSVNTPRRIDGSLNLLFSSSMPRLDLYSNMVAIYSNKTFTYPEDVLPAFSGLSSALSSTFGGGFYPTGGLNM